MSKLLIYIVLKVLMMIGQEIIVIDSFEELVELHYARPPVFPLIIKHLKDSEVPIIECLPKYVFLLDTSFFHDIKHCLIEDSFMERSKQLLGNVDAGHSEKVPEVRIQTVLEEGLRLLVVRGLNHTHR